MRCCEQAQARRPARQDYSARDAVLRAVADCEPRQKHLAKFLRLPNPPAPSRCIFLIGNFIMQSSLECKKGLHVAMIMDGNGRWPTARGLPRTAGHHAGVAALQRVCEAAPALGVTTLSLFAFSSDNWRRPRGEGGIDCSRSDAQIGGYPPLPLIIIGGRRRSKLPCCGCTLNSRVVQKIACTHPLTPRIVWRTVD
jgi:hypothetical protein